MAKIINFLRRLFMDSHKQKINERVGAWFAAKGDKTLRVEYDLTQDSIVFDLGGYEGQWTSDIFSRYCCTVYVFEPIKRLADDICKRFVHNHRIRVFTFGLSADNSQIQLSLGDDSSSQYKDNGESVEATLIKASDFFDKYGITSIDLIKINIEGGEYDLLEHLLDTGFIAHIRDIQVQFHDFVPEAEVRMKRIQERLSKTHVLTYNFPFVWENWRRIENTASTTACTSPDI